MTLSFRCEASEINPVCVDCGLEMRAQKSGATFALQDSPGTQVHGDIFACPGCKKRVGTNFGEHGPGNAPADVTFSQGFSPARQAERLLSRC